MKFLSGIESVVYAISIYGLLIGVPICLLLLIAPKTRPYGGLGFVILSYPVGLWVWLACLMYALSVSVFWAIIGILLAGIGVIPVTLVMTIVRGDWSNLGTLLINVVIVFALRSFGHWLVGRTEEV